MSVDAHTASMGRSGERVDAGVTTGLMGLGDVVTWRARHFCLIFRMTSAITAWDRPRRFVDQQRSGPFASWRHEHTFTPLGADQTLIRDTAEFRSPLGAVGGVVDRLVLQRYLTRLLQQRNAWLKAALEAVDPGESPISARKAVDRKD